ncbi:MAG: hypothetical protein ACYC7A_20170 [Thermoanaerobaculia bacterium]
MNLSRIVFTVTFVLGLAAARPASACWQCVYDTIGANWRASALAPTERGVRVRLVHYDPETGSHFADLYFDAASESWRRVVPADASEARQRELEAERRRLAKCRSIPYKPPSVDDAIALRPHLRVNHSVEETPDSCFEADGLVWFGLAFYEGEGADGVGGLGRYRPSDGSIEVRRPRWLRDKSVDHIAYDGRFLWITAIQRYEGSGIRHGLAHYDWERDLLEPLAGTGDGPCAIGIGDMILHRGELWVAGGVAVSRLNLTTGVWTHFRPDRIGAAFTPAPCSAIHERILEAHAKCPSACEGESEAETMARFAPEATRRFLSKLPIRSWTTNDFSAAGLLARDFDELDRLVLRRARGVSTRNLRWALANFAEKRCPDPRWRDYAVAFARKTGDFEIVSRLQGDPIAGAMVRDALEPHPTREAVDALPWILGRDAIPLLIRLLDVEVDRDDHNRMADRADVIEALERAAHLRIEADGSRQTLAANSDTWEYAEEEFGAFRRSGKDSAVLARIAAHWKEWWEAARSGRGGVTH